MFGIKFGKKKPKKDEWEETEERQFKAKLEQEELAFEQKRQKDLRDAKLVSEVHNVLKDGTKTPEEFMHRLIDLKVPKKAQEKLYTMKMTMDSVMSTIKNATPETLKKTFGTVGAALQIFKDFNKGKTPQLEDKSIINVEVVPEGEDKKPKKKRNTKK